MLRLNPYSNGILSDLWLSSSSSQNVVSLNPYSNGILSDSYSTSYKNEMGCLNPYSNGILSDEAFGFGCMATVMS